MGGVMGAPSAMGAWILLLVVLVLALGVTGGVLIARGPHARRNAEPPQIPPADSRAVREAKDVLRLRYAKGEIGREEYLQGKVELED